MCCAVLRLVWPCLAIRCLVSSRVVSCCCLELTPVPPGTACYPLFPPTRFLLDQRNITLLSSSHLHSVLIPNPGGSGIEHTIVLLCFSSFNPLSLLLSPQIKFSWRAGGFIIPSHLFPPPLPSFQRHSRLRHSVRLSPAQFQPVAAGTTYPLLPNPLPISTSALTSASATATPALPNFDPPTRSRPRTLPEPRPGCRVASSSLMWAS